MVECDLAKVEVASSNLVSRSSFSPEEEKRRHGISDAAFSVLRFRIGLRLLHEFQRDAVDTVSETGRLWPVIENVPEVRIAPGA